MHTARRATVVAILAALAVAVVVTASGCGPAVPRAEKAGEPVVPAPYDLSDPEAAVRSYLEWVSFSYRMANSEIPTATMTPSEGVRVDAYIQLNRMEGRGLEQQLTSFEVRSMSVETTNAVVAAREDWGYRYFSLEDLGYATEPLQASYETTYTLVREEQGWLVDRVEAAAVGEVE